MTIRLHDYQQQAVRFALTALQQSGGVGLFLDMGLGKTMITITIMSLLHAADSSLRFLVVAPKLPAYRTWPDELEKTRELHDLSWSVACGSHMNATQRMRQVTADATVTIINQENLVWLDEQLRVWPWRFIVLDELSAYRSPGAKRFRVLKRRRKTMRGVIGLTGTPAPKSLLDLWAPVTLLDGGRAFGTLTRFRSEYFTPGRRNGHIIYEWLAKPDTYERIMSRIRPFCLTMRAKDRLKGMPDMLISNILVDMPQATRAAYDRFRRDYLLQLGDTSVDAVNAGVLVNRLTQFTAGLLYSDDHARVHWLDEAKLDALTRLVDDLGEPILIFYWFQGELTRLRERFGSRLHTVDEPNIVTEWNKGRVGLLAAQPMSAKFGLNLQQGGHIIVWLSLPWSMEDWLQANARLARQGQSETVRVFRLVEPDTIDDRKLAVLEQRIGLQDALMAELANGFCDESLRVEAHGTGLHE